MYMMLDKDDIIQLAHTKVNKVLLCGRNSLQVKLAPQESLLPCKGCVFSRKNGCGEGIHNMKYACMSRFRSDVNSVIFISKR